MSRILVIKTGKTYDSIRERYGCFEDWMAAGLGVPAAELAVVRVFEGELLPSAMDDVCGILITGSPAMVTERQPWSEATARWLRHQLAHGARGMPTLGICYGHQLLAHAFGGVVDYNPNGREIGTVQLQAKPALADDPLLGTLRFPLQAHVTHMQSVTALPPDAVPLAHSALEPHHAFRLGDHVWGLQFHPEFSDDIMRAYVDLLAQRMKAEGICPDTTRNRVAECPESSAVLKRFAALARRHAAARAAVTAA